MAKIELNAPAALLAQGKKDLQGKVDVALQTLNDNLAERQTDYDAYDAATTAEKLDIVKRMLAREQDYAKLLRSVVKYLAKDLA